MRILGVSGSLRARSSNFALIETASRCAPAGMMVMRYEGLGAHPLFNPDRDAEPLPREVGELRRAVGESAGLLICSPEYARGVAGAMKNALDWLVGSAEFAGKPVALWNASQRATDADAHLRLTLRTMNGWFVDEASVTLPLLGLDADARILAATPAIRAPMVAALMAFRDAIRGRES